MATQPPEKRVARWIETFVRMFLCGANRTKAHSSGVKPKISNLKGFFGATENVKTSVTADMSPVVPPEDNHTCTATASTPPPAATSASDTADTAVTSAPDTAVTSSCHTAPTSTRNTTPTSIRGATPTSASERHHAPSHSRFRNLISQITSSERVGKIKGVFRKLRGHKMKDKDNAAVDFPDDDSEDLPGQAAPPTSPTSPKPSTLPLDSVVELSEMERYKIEAFGSVAMIPDDALIALASSFIPAVDLTGEPSDSAKVTRDTIGTNNRVFIVQLGEDRASKVCIRVPACGREGLWTSKDGEVLRDYALVMKMIGENTCFPVPKIFGFDCTMANVIGAPYIAMSFAQGRPIDQIWYEAGDRQEEKRQRILKTLAEASAKLKPFEFSEMGAVKFPEDNDKTPYIGDYYNANFGNTTRDECFFKQQEDLYVVERHTSSWIRARQRLERRRLRMFDEHEDEDRSTGDLHAGMAIDAYYAVMLDLIESNTLNFVSNETFVLVHPDYDWQNILADDDGNITAIIDWDRAESKPRFAGWSRFPDFLTLDWDEEYTWPDEKKAQMSPWELDRYRSDFACYMKKACGEEDSRFTAKSDLYYSIWKSAGYEDQQFDNICRVLALIFPYLTNIRGHLVEIGKMVEKAEDPLVELGIKARLVKLFSI